MGKAWDLKLWPLIKNPVYKDPPFPQFMDNLKSYQHQLLKSKILKP